MAYNADLDCQTNLTPEEVTALEAMVDRLSLSDVMYALSAICRAKGDHLRSNWQDNAAAKMWECDGSVIDKAVCRLA